MKARITQSSYWELILGISLVAVQLCAWPKESMQAMFWDNVPAVLRLQQGPICEKVPHHFYNESGASSHLNTPVSILKES